MDITTGKTLDTDAHTAAGFKPVQNSGAIILSSDGKTLTSLTTIGSGEQYVKYQKSDITGPMVENTFGAEGAMAGYTLTSSPGCSGTTLSALSDGGSNFQITF